MALYHKELGFPAHVKFSPLFALKYSFHAKEAAKGDRYGEIADLPLHFLPRLSEVIEIELDEKKELIKLVSRQHYNDELDLILVISVKDKLVRTVWLNAKTDKHFTLDRTKYITPGLNSLQFA